MKFEIEMYDLKQEIGKGTTGYTYNSKEEAIKVAKEIFRGMCEADKENTELLINIVNDEELVETVFTVNKENYKD